MGVNDQAVQLGQIEVFACLDDVAIGTAKPQLPISTFPDLGQRPAEREP